MRNVNHDDYEPWPGRSWVTECPAITSRSRWATKVKKSLQDQSIRRTMLADLHNHALKAFKPPINMHNPSTRCRTSAKVGHISGLK